MIGESPSALLNNLNSEIVLNKSRFAAHETILVISAPTSGSPLGQLPRRAEFHVALLYSNAHAPLI